MNKQAGFTLLETMIAMAIMVLAFSAIFRIQSTAITSADKTRSINVITMLARSIMAETEIKIEGKAFNEIKEEESGDFPEPYKDYTWKRKIKEVEFPNLMMSSGGDKSNQEGGEMIEQMTKLVTKFLGDSIREVVVTISAKKGSEKLDYSITMYWVDLNHEFSLTQ